jgi:hypothetical protein
MRTGSKIAQFRSRPGNIALLLILPLLSVGISFIISRVGFSSALVFIVGIVGLALAVFMVAFPVFAFYLTLTFSFFIFTLLRLFNTELPIVTAIDGMVWLTFLGVLVNKAIKKQSSSSSIISSSSSTPMGGIPSYMSCS